MGPSTASACWTWVGLESCIMSFCFSSCKVAVFMAFQWKTSITSLFTSGHKAMSQRTKLDTKFRLTILERCFSLVHPLHLALSSLHADVNPTCLIWTLNARFGRASTPHAANYCELDNGNSTAAPDFPPTFSARTPSHHVRCPNDENQTAGGTGTWIQYSLQDTSKEALNLRFQGTGH